jgi:CRP-like cAMP-binding protein
MAADTLEALRKIPIFADLSERELRKILKATEEYSYPPGAVIVAEGSRSEQLFLILDGNVKVKHGGRTVARMGVGDFFGEIALIDGLPRTASVVADTPVRCRVLLRKEFFEIIDAAPQIGWRVLGTLATRLRERERANRV